MTQVPGTPFQLNTATLVPMALVVGSFVAYHGITRTLRPDAPPFVFLCAVYATSLLASGILAKLLPSAAAAGGGTAPGLEWRDLLWAAALGLVLVGIEAGFILAYRAGWGVSLAPTVANVMVALVLVPLGALLLREPVSGVNLAGLALAVLGLVLMAHRG
jgi:drug/metabolite transporter (DMT)-like permease